MKLLNLIIIAYRSMSKNKLRSFLTMLGIIIGVASVIAMLAIGQGSKKNIQKSEESPETNTIMIMPGAITQGGVRLSAGSSNSLKNEDADAIATRCDLLQYVSPVVNKGVQVIAGSQNWSTMIIGAKQSYFNIRNITVSMGEKFTELDERTAAK